MPQFNEYSSDGRTLMVKFTCGRCRREQIDALEDHKNDAPEGYGQLHDIKPPKGWKSLHGLGPLLCADCMRDYEAFMMGPGTKKSEAPQRRLRRGCKTCEKYGWNMPECAECNRENDYEWYEAKKENTEK